MHKREQITNEKKIIHSMEKNSKLLSSCVNKKNEIGPLKIGEKHENDSEEIMILMDQYKPVPSTKKQRHGNSEISNQTKKNAITDVEVNEMIK